ncbi:MAG TPA: thioesterase family protein [Mycobacteriales bacterium]|nr:thioesterase family protein [Mycobacteriales bacterium]
MVYTHRVRVRFSDTDAMGHVNNATFLTYLEEARLHYLSSLPTALVVGGLILARAECDYVRPITVDPEPLEVAVWIDAVGRSSFGIGYTITQRGQVAARGRSVQVTYDYAANTSRPLSEDERQALTAAMQENPSPEPGAAE